MIIAIDETGSFHSGSTEMNFFVAAHIRQRKTFYKQKKFCFKEWENTLPKNIKNSKGEFKSNKLSNERLTEFVRKVVCSHYYIGITPLAIRPSKNDETLIEKYKSVQHIGIIEGVKFYKNKGRDKNAKLYEDFGNWHKKLSYVQFLKIFMLGACISSALVNTVGHSISGGYDNELTRIKILIDKDFIKEPQHNIFWRELLRNQIYAHSKKSPMPVLKTWLKNDHPFLKKYMSKGYIDLNELFWKHTSFVLSHKNFEIRIADTINTVLNRYFNKKECNRAYKMLKKCFLQHGKVTELLLNDFDLDKWEYNPNDNPWLNLEAHLSI